MMLYVRKFPTVYDNKEPPMFSVYCHHFLGLPNPMFTPAAKSMVLCASISRCFASVNCTGTPVRPCSGSPPRYLFRQDSEGFHHCGFAFGCLCSNADQWCNMVSCKPQNDPATNGNRIFSPMRTGRTGFLGSAGGTRVQSFGLYGFVGCNGFPVTTMSVSRCGGASSVGGGSESRAMTRRRCIMVN